MKHFARLAAAAILAASTGAAAWAADTTLRISTWLPPTHGINTEIFAGLIGMMEEATDGQVSGELVFGLAPPPAQMDLIQDGAADMAIIFHGYQPGRFIGTKLIELPGYEGNAEAASVAYWRVHTQHLGKLGEHRGVKLVALNTHGPGQIHTSKDVATLADLNGLKTRIGGGVAGDVGAALGLVGINVPAPKVYETLESGAADAVAMNVGERVGFKLNEVAKNLYDMPGGLYRGSFAIIMSQETFDSLPADVQAALDEKVFGEPASRMAGAAWDKSDMIAYEATRGTEGAKIVEASAEDQAAFAAIAAEVTAKVLAELDAAGVDAQAAYDMVKAEMAAN
ncbi:TRAP transporter substrate-binding protein [Ruegeria pomeroyi]|uniref:TRAP transporter substrate-binding protein n=1 Tax=Ruegeria alba TaxID=2916756 RepID=A0ABS9P2A6_9RHOB|nr:TRAP transporter substrate-binding protein [Ruegeria alba]MCE8518099.1 TRAP transporter substrate-binding protein [Ruegeria pomeroyi]MCE8521056.1 TRAP transporter substrate-binding protein [Ruegeria pomeroyi]MCE8533564.1 TRAP transporter substrate-binding protein [Ruegeria pomeroyi]MCG6560244.1 TRAP transporter substrate-binding protein [Ruegeria alba]